MNILSRLILYPLGGIFLSKINAKSCTGFVPINQNRSRKKDNKEALQLAEDILALRKSEFLQGRYGFKNQSKAKRPFLVLRGEDKGEIRLRKNYGVWESAYYHLNNCVNPNLLFDEIDDNFVKRVRDYFDREARTKSNLPLSQNSEYSYFNKSKARLRSSFDDGYLSINYAGRVKAFAQGKSQREYLTFDELQALSNTPCKYEILITFHSARHTNAVLLLENGADLFTVQKRLGHKEIKTTAIYAKLFRISFSFN